MLGLNMYLCHAGEPFFPFFSSFSLTRHCIIAIFHQEKLTKVDFRLHPSQVNAIQTITIRVIIKLMETDIAKKNYAFLRGNFVLDKFWHRDIECRFVTLDKKWPCYESIYFLWIIWTRLMCMIMKFGIEPLWTNTKAEKEISFALNLWNCHYEITGKICAKKPTNVWRYFFRAGILYSRVVKIEDYMVTRREVLPVSTEFFHLQLFFSWFHRRGSKFTTKKIAAIHRERDIFFDWNNVTGNKNCNWFFSQVIICINKRKVS